MEFSKKVGISIKKALYVTLKKTIPPIHENNIGADDDDKMNTTGGNTLKIDSSCTINTDKSLKYNGSMNGSVARNLDDDASCAPDSTHNMPTTTNETAETVNPGSPIIENNRSRSRSVSRANSDTMTKIIPESNTVIRRKSVNGDQLTNGVTESKPYECVICTAQFARKSCLNSHLRAHIEGPDKILHSGIETTSESTHNGPVIDQVKIEDVTSSEHDQKSDEMEEIMEYKMEIDDIKTDVEVKMEIDENPLMEEREELKEVNVTQMPSESKTTANGALESKDDQTDEADTSGKQYKCYMCDARFARNSSLMWHIQFHETHLLSKNKRSTIMDENEVEEVGEDGEFKCTVCDRDFTHSISFRKHMNGVHKLNIDGSPYVPSDHVDGGPPGKRPTKCPRCGRVFSTRSNMTKHLRQYCKVMLEETFTEDTTAEIPQELDTTNTELMCIPCGGRLFTSRRALSIHIASKHKSREKSIDNDEDLKQDEEDELIGEQDNNEHSFKCNHCDQSFDTYRGMRIHATYRHGPSAKSDEQTSIVENTEEVELDESGDVESQSYECDVCHEVFDHYRSYSSHAGWHRRRRDHSPTPIEEEIDELLDPDTSKYTCDYCGRIFASSQSKAGHMKAHRTDSSSTDAAKKTDVEEADLSDAGSSIELKLSPDNSSSSLSVECRVCGKMLLSKASLGGHMKVHSETERTVEALPKMTPLPDDYVPQHGDEVLDCAYCGKSFLRKHDLAKHIREHLTGLIKPESIDLGVFRCKYCQRSFSGRKSLNSHTAAHERGTLIDEDHSIPSPPIGVKRPSSGEGLPKLKFPKNDDKFYKCNICGREFLLRCLLQKHQLLHGSDGSESTQAATTTGDSHEKRKRKSTLKDSTYEYEPLIGHRCEECGKTFSNRLNLLKHEASHADMPYECPHCDQAFARYDTLLEHSRSHREYQPNNDYALEDDDSDVELECGRRVVVFSPDGYQEEFVFDDGPGNEGFLCSECDEVYDDKLQMIVHMSYHVANRRGLKNGQREAIVVKANTTVLAPYQCKFCDERFINKQFRSRHLANRHKEDVFECDVCHKLFVQRSSLESHCKSHIMEQRWRCPYCRKQFTSKWFWKRHMKKQCPQRKIQEATALRYKCEFCDAVLDEKRLWEEHLQTHVITYGCDNCNFRCENVIELEGHSCIVMTTEMTDIVQEKSTESGKLTQKHNIIEPAKGVK